MSKTITPTVLQSDKTGDVDDVFFDVTLVVDKDNKVIVVDNLTEDYKDIIDCNTLCIKQVKIDI